MPVLEAPTSQLAACVVDDRATLARLFWDRVGASSTRDAHIVRRDGVWVRSPWAEVGEVVREVAEGLLALGRRPGDAVGILARSRAEWVETDFAILSAAGVTVPIYPTSTADEIGFIVNDADVRTLFVEGGPSLARVLDTRSGMPRLEQVIVLGEAAGDHEGVLGWYALRELGRARRAGHELDDRMVSARADDVATVVYTSGTTGVPKGVVQTHRNHLAMLRALGQLPGVRPGDVHLLVVPLAHALGRMEAFLGVHRGLITAFCEDPRWLVGALRAVHPDILFAVPRLFEKAHLRVMTELQAGSRIRRLLFRAALGVARAASALDEFAIPVPWGLRLARGLARRLVLRRVRAAFGGRLKFAVSGGAALGREHAEFFHAVGIPVLEGYGLTEACPALTWNRLDCFRFGSVGQALPGVELRIAPDGEVLARAPNVARGYLNRPEASAAVFGADGWLRTGDIGRLDAEGFLYITDRKKDVMVTSTGLHIAPQPIETALRRAPMIAEAMLYGDGRPYVTALVTLDGDAAERVVRAGGHLAVEATALARHPAVLDEIRRVVEATNTTLPSHARIRRFVIAPAPFTEAGGELTPTQKVKRRVVAERHHDLLDALYRVPSGG
jgi:long-chain acyl-CoA synthetase